MKKERAWQKRINPHLPCLVFFCLAAIQSTGLVVANHFTTRLRHQSSQSHDVDRTPDEANRAVGETDVRTANMECVNVSLQIVAIPGARSRAEIRDRKSTRLNS